jgi:spore coat polysaccharide biosynthesis protein SpsF
MTAVVLQARLDSSRLPGKSLLPLGSKPLIFRVMEALSHVPADRYVLACPDECVNEFSPLAHEANFELIAGPKDDVLERYCMAIRAYGIDWLIRATGDNPFVFTDAARAIHAEGLRLSADYAGYAGLPVGAGVEAVNAAALLQAADEADSPYEREHVCPYLYAHPEKFLLHRPLAPLRWQEPEVRLTIDTEEDYERATLLYAALEKYTSDGERYRASAIMETYHDIFTKGNRAL